MLKRSRMSKYTREPTFKEFIEWCKDNEELAERFFEDHIIFGILELEQDDYFGTEGFDKRFG